MINDIFLMPHISYDEFQWWISKDFRVRGVVYIRDVNLKKLRMQYRMNCYLSLFKKCILNSNLKNLNVARSISWLIYIKLMCLWLMEEREKLNKTLQICTMRSDEGVGLVFKCWLVPWSKSQSLITLWEREILYGLADTHWA